LLCFNNAIAMAPNYAKAYCNRSNVLNEMQRYEDAIISGEHALALDANLPEAYCSCGNALRQLGRLEEALTAFDHAINLCPQAAIFYGNRGNTLRDLYRFEEALADFEVAITLAPHNTNIWINRGNVLRELKRFDEARASYAHAVDISPDDADAHWDVAIIDLLRGDMANGWDGYEWRWHSPSLAHAVRSFTYPLWTGAEDISGKTILIHAEQGLGDTVQFSRYIPMVLAKGARVLFEVPETLLALLASLGKTAVPGQLTLIPTGSPLPDFDLHCPTMSLPRAFKTRLGTIPGATPYLSADPGKRLKWQQQLGARKDLRVGLVWAGKQGTAPDRKRSISVAQFAPILGLPFDFHCLQKEIRQEDIDILTAFPFIQCHSEALHDFSDTAALIAEMDLVISVDTSIAHVTGALGKPLWLLLPAVPDWRWLMDRTDSPWYPSAQLFRQQNNGDWGTVFDDVARSLTAAKAAGTVVATAI
ncbi:MAG: tetratricopeptide repeat-containing glycosyltransferase family protein, partial [Rhizomicrobium sp.]